MLIIYFVKINLQLNSYYKALEVITIHYLRLQSCFSYQPCNMFSFLANLAQLSVIEYLSSAAPSFCI